MGAPSRTLWSIIGLDPLARGLATTHSIAGSRDILDPWARIIIFWYLFPLVDIDVFYYYFDFPVYKIQSVDQLILGNICCISLFKGANQPSATECSDFSCSPPVPWDNRSTLSCVYARKPLNKITIANSQKIYKFCFRTWFSLVSTSFPTRKCHGDERAPQKYSDTFELQHGAILPTRIPSKCSRWSARRVLHCNCCTVQVLGSIFPFVWVRITASELYPLYRHVQLTLIISWWEILNSLSQRRVTRTAFFEWVWITAPAPLS